jgi:hypothetical protein
MSINPEAGNNPPPERDWNAEFAGLAAEARIPLSLRLQLLQPYHKQLAANFAEEVKAHPETIGQEPVIEYGASILKLLQRNLAKALPEEEKPEAGLYALLFRQGFGAAERLMQFRAENNASLDQRELFESYNAWQQGDPETCHREMSRYFINLHAGELVHQLFSGKVHKVFVKSTLEFTVPGTDDVIKAPGKESWVQGPRTKGMLCALFFMRAHICANIYDDEMHMRHNEEPQE